MTSVLLVDDNINLVRSMSLILKHKGFDVDITSNGFEAIEKVEEKKYDMIFLDIKMPYINGVETFKRIKSINPNSVVMMMTAYSVEELIEEALEEGALGIIYKPVDIEQIVSKINNEREKKKGAFILVVDDDLGTANNFRKILIKQGYSVAVCANGDEAIDIALKNDFDILFIDIKLPTINGLETYMVIKKAKPNVVAIMMTGFRQEVNDLVVEALDNDAYTCLYKPLNMSRILQLIEEILKRKEGVSH